MPNPRRDAENEGGDDGSSAHVPLSGGEAKTRLVGRIANALQVPLAMLYDPHAPAASKEGDAGVIAADLDRECLALLQAFRRIQNSEERRRLLGLVQEAGDRA